MEKKLQRRGGVIYRLGRVSPNVSDLKEIDSIQNKWQKKLQRNSVLHRLSPRLYNWWYSK